MQASQAEIWWAQLPQPAGRRPVLVLTRSSIIGQRMSVTVAPLTRSNRHIRSEVILSPADGVPTACVISLDNIGTFPKRMLDKRLTALAPAKMQEVFAAIRFAFAIPHDA